MTITTTMGAQEKNASIWDAREMYQENRSSKMHCIAWYNEKYSSNYILLK